MTQTKLKTDFSIKLIIFKIFTLLHARQKAIDNLPWLRTSFSTNQNFPWTRYSNRITIYNQMHVHKFKEYMQSVEHTLKQIRALSIGNSNLNQSNLFTKNYCY